MWHLVCFLILASFPGVNCNEENKLYQGVPDAYFKDCLAAINKYRKLHDAYPLRWNADLQYHAQAWADELAKSGTVQNDVEGIDRLGQGETVSYVSPSMKKCRTFPPSEDCYACRTTIASWYNESKYYDYKTGFSRDGRRQVLHFTQLVWKDTVKVGIATAVSPRHGVITVARYHPRGNIGYADDYVRNVAPLASSKEEEREAGTSEGGGTDIDEPGPQKGPQLPLCRRRKHKRKSRECFNEYDDELCDSYAVRFPGYCNYSSDFMKKHCAKSCGFCNDRFPAPAVLETKDEKRHNLKWQTGDWLECHGGLQWRPVRCLHNYKGRDYEIRLKHCAVQLGPKPPEYKDCP